MSDHGFDIERMSKFSEMRRALRRARGWLNMIAQDRPETSDIHAVLAEVDAALASADTHAKRGDAKQAPSDG